MSVLLDTKGLNVICSPTKSIMDPGSWIIAAADCGTGSVNLDLIEIIPDPDNVPYGILLVVDIITEEGSLKGTIVGNVFNASGPYGNTTATVNGVFEDVYTLQVAFEAGSLNCDLTIVN